MIDSLLQSVVFLQPHNEIESRISIEGKAGF